MSNRRVLSLLARRLEAVRLAPSTPPVEGVGRLTGVGRGSAAWSARAEDRPASRSPAMAHWAEWRRGMSKAKWPFPKSGGVEGFPDQYVRSIKRRVTKKEHHVGQNVVPEPTPGVFIGNFPETGVERHFRAIGEETRRAMDTILDIESSSSGDPNKPDLPSMEEIDAEESEEARLRAERRESEKEREDERRANRVAVRDATGASSATGRRKTSVARVTIRPGDGAVTINDRPFDAHIPDINHRAMMIRPFLVTDTMGLFDVDASVRGGGLSGQAQAIRHGLARALELYEPDFRPALKKEGMLTRDPRKVERKKPGRKKARKAFQWVKR